MKSITILFFAIIFSQLAYSQNQFIEAVFYKDYERSKQVKESKASYKLIKEQNGDTLIEQFIRLEDNVVVTKRCFIDSKPVGEWVVSFGETEQPLRYTYGKKDFESSIKKDPNASILSLNNKELTRVLMLVRYPAIALDNDHEGEVFVQFIISENGSAESIRVESDAGEFLDKEAVRVVSQLRDLKPLKLEGGKLLSSCIMSVKFRLN